jgi:hypothetical protein
MTQVETIQIEVSSELARRLRPYQTKLPRILEWGLHHVEGETGAETGAESAPEAMSWQKRVVAALRRAGAVGPDPEEMAQYLAQRENQCWSPIQAGGKPAR